ncbi:FHA domain-containing protein [Candidatus Uabimicrobium sp. HlEnr_7]|uniref:FHA domain-containing protein n=1 Tax=Candidatus Uabimicrobium helgolandensis TaxID=3095367 RepID=UPI0035575495
MEPCAKLIVFLRDQKLEFILNKENMTIGRGVNQSIVINEPTISRLHAKIFIRDGSYFLEDLSTFQKTYLNKGTIQIPKNLKHKDIIQLGNVKSLFLLEKLKPEEQHVLEEVQYTFKGDYQKGEEDDIHAPIQAEVSDIFASVEDVLDDKEQVEIEEAPLSTGESLDMPLSEIPFANPVTFTEEAPPVVNVVSRVLDAHILCENTRQCMPITKEAIYIGFDSINEIQIADPYFSKVHFALLFNKKSNKYYLKNMGDKEVRCNGTPIENMEELDHYSIISTGKYKFHFFSGFQEVADLQKIMLEEIQNNAFPMRFFPELPGETVILDSSALQLKGEYQFMGAPSPFLKNVFFTKDVDSSKYMFLGEIIGNKDDLPSSTIDPYLVKIQGIFETILEYETIPLQIMKDFNRIIYSKYKGLSINGTLIMLHRDNIIWVGDGVCSPIAYLEGKSIIQSSKGMPIGCYKNFLGYEQRLTWKENDKILFFTSGLLGCNLKSQSLLVTLESLKLLLGSKISQEGFSLGKLTEDLLGKIETHQEILLTLISREPLG